MSGSSLKTLFLGHFFFILTKLFVGHLESPQHGVVMQSFSHEFLLFFFW